MEAAPTMDLSPDWLEKLTKDLKMAAATLSTREVRFLVDFYYVVQNYRIRSGNQVRASADGEEPNVLVDWMFRNQKRLEAHVKAAMDVYSDSTEVGRWSKRVMGIGPVLAAGLLAHIDIERAPTVGHIWRFAGLDPTLEWESGKKRPWNARLKVLCWKIGESFVKVKGKDADVYGKIYESRKVAEVARNLAGEFEDQARRKLTRFKIGKTTDAYPWYAGCYTAEQARIAVASAKPIPLVKGLVDSGLPMLPPGHLHARAKRYAVKLFLAHWHHVAFLERYKKEPPKPYILEHGGHVHMIAPPHLASDPESTNGTGASQSS